MKTIAQDTGNPRHGRKNLSVAYCNECALRDKGLDCLFCNINATRVKFAEKENIQWKTPKQIAETVKAAYDEGYDHFTVTGGFVPERREVEYYLDVAKAIQEELGTEDFHGTACIGAPKDLTVIEKYKLPHGDRMQVQSWRDIRHQRLTGIDYIRKGCGIK